jgi:hypothetical protein
MNDKDEIKTIIVHPSSGWARENGVVLHVYQKPGRVTLLYKNGRISHVTMEEINRMITEIIESNRGKNSLTET